MAKNTEKMLGILLSSCDVLLLYLRASNSDTNWFCCYLLLSHFGSVPPDMGTRSVVCSSAPLDYNQSPRIQAKRMAVKLYKYD